MFVSQYFDVFDVSLYFPRVPFFSLRRIILRYTFYYLRASPQWKYHLERYTFFVLLFKNEWFFTCYSNQIIRAYTHVITHKELNPYFLRKSLEYFSITPVCIFYAMYVIYFRHLYCKCFVFVITWYRFVFIVHSVFYT